MSTENKTAVQLEITYQQFEDVIVTALEGGSDYWYLIDVRTIVGKPKGEPWSTFIAREVWNEELELQVYDVEDESLLGTLSKESFLANAGREPWALLELMNERLDADSADVLFQLAVMGEVVFG